jgi:hypothetical protein
MTLPRFMKTFLIPRLTILTEVTATTACKAAEKFAGVPLPGTDRLKFYSILPS